MRFDERDAERYTWLCAALYMIYVEGREADLSELEKPDAMWHTSPEARRHAAAIFDALEAWTDDRP